MEENKNWYVVYTRPRWEKKVAQRLLDEGIVHYCPLNKVARQWSDRRKFVLEPLFKGYVFVQLLEKNKWPIKEVDGILNFVYWLGKPAIVRDEEIETIKKFLLEFDHVAIVNADVAINDKVVIKEGLMMDYEGMVLEVSGNNVKVQIQSMGLALSAVFRKSNLEIRK